MPQKRQYTSDEKTPEKDTSDQDNSDEKESEEVESGEDDSDDEKESDEEEKKEGIRLSLSGEIPEVSRDDLDNLAEIFSDRGILRASTTGGEDITSEVEVSYERDDEDEDKYIVTFEVEHNGNGAEIESAVRVKD